MKNLDRQVFNLVKRTPKGKITTYQLLAKKLGNKQLARLVGNILSKNKHLLVIPCHRVVKSNGQVGGYKLGLAKKIKFLQNEGINIKNGRILNFKKCLYSFN